MSKLSQLIRKASRVEPPPLGFGAVSREATASMLLLARFPAGPGERLREAASRGVDAVLVDGEGAASAASMLKGLSLPWGALLPEARREALGPLQEAGVDFLVFGEGSEASLFWEEGLGLVLAAREESSDVELRLLESLPLDALWVPAPPSPLTVARQLTLRRFSGLARLPLLVEVRPPVDAAYLRGLRDAGVVGVVVDGEVAWEEIPSLRQTVQSLPARGRRREERPEPVLPAATLLRPPQPEEEEE
ncbi:hypothetical protein HRbin25_00418 [bacterium HR25]|jgi:hypothetical protein|nr:hypothetical protein HRbin25_00418 [bacterium HR25]